MYRKPNNLCILNLQITESISSNSLLVKSRFVQYVESHYLQTVIMWLPAFLVISLLFFKNVYFPSLSPFYMTSFLFQLVIHSSLSLLLHFIFNCNFCTIYFGHLPPFPILPRFPTSLSTQLSIVPLSFEKGRNKNESKTRIKTRKITNKRIQSKDK